MKLNNEYIIQEVCGVSVAISPNSQNMVKLSETGAFIFSMLQQERQQDEILSTLCERYDAPKEVLQSDLTKFLDELYSAGLLTI